MRQSERATVLYPRNEPGSQIIIFHSFLNFLKYFEKELDDPHFLSVIFNIATINLCKKKKLGNFILKVIVFCIREMALTFADYTHEEREMDFKGVMYRPFSCNLSDVIC